MLRGEVEVREPDVAVAGQKPAAGKPSSDFGQVARCGENRRKSKKWRRSPKPLYRVSEQANPASFCGERKFALTVRRGSEQNHLRRFGAAACERKFDSSVSRSRLACQRETELIKVTETFLDDTRRPGPGHRQASAPATNC